MCIRPACPLHAHRLSACIALASLCMASSDPSRAQTCTVPAAITANTSYVFDTCQGESSLAFVCGALPLAGPAAVVLLDMHYPLGSVLVRSLDAGFEPYAFVLHADCDGSAPCSAGTPASPGAGGTIDLPALDSGRYYLVIAATQGTPGAPCGLVQVYAAVTPEQDDLLQEGLFRADIAPLWEP